MSAMGQPIIEHLGDGVYASIGGGMIGLAVNDHRSEPVVWLEPATLDALIEFRENHKGILQ